jgi:hypothetical protein
MGAVFSAGIGGVIEWLPQARCCIRRTRHVLFARRENRGSLQFVEIQNAQEKPRAPQKRATRGDQHLSHHKQPCENRKRRGAQQSLKGTVKMRSADQLPSARS